MFLLVTTAYSNRNLKSKFYKTIDILTKLLQKDLSCSIIKR